VKILMATHYFASHGGGIEIVAGQLFREFASMQQDIVWMATDASLPPATEARARTVGLRAFNFVEKKFGLPLPIPTLAALKKVRDEARMADVVIIHDCLYLTNIAAFLTAKLAKKPVIIVQHIGFVPYSSCWVRGLMKLANLLATRPMLGGAHQVVFISETIKRHFNTIRFRATPELVFNGVDCENFRPLGAEQTKTELRKRFGLVPDRPVALFVGRFVEKKGLSVLRRMARMAPEYTWVFAGWGPLDPRTWNASNVHVFSDLHDRGLADLYRASDVFVLPSTGEGFPLVVQEALACGLAVICGADTATADPALGRFVRGTEVQTGNDSTTANTFLAAIAEVLASESKAPHGQYQRRQFALTNYSWRKAAGHYLAIASRFVPESKGSGLATAGGCSPGGSSQFSAPEAWL